MNKILFFLIFFLWTNLTYAAGYLKITCYSEDRTHVVLVEILKLTSGLEGHIRGREASVKETSGDYLLENSAEFVIIDKNNPRFARTGIGRFGSGSTIFPHDCIIHENSLTVKSKTEIKEKENNKKSNSGLKELLKKIY